MDDEEIIKDIYSIPSWVKNEKDLEIYAAHLMYRLMQSNSIKFFYETKCDLKLTEEQDMECSKIYQQYERCYNKARTEMKENKLVPLFGDK